MSLIHQALKKVESSKHGYDVPPDIGSARSVMNKSGYRSFAAVGIAAAVLIFAVFNLYSTRLAGTQIKKTASSNTPADTVIEASTPANPTPHEDSITVSAFEHNKKGAYLYRILQYDDAAGEFKAAIELKPEENTFHNNLALAYMALNDLKEAEKSFKDALRLKPGDPEAANNYGALLDKMGEHDKAMEWFEKAVNLNPNYPDPHLNMAISLESRNLYSEAVTHYEAFLRLNPGASLNDGVQRKLKSLRNAP